MEIVEESGEFDGKLHFPFYKMIVVGAKGMNIPAGTKQQGMGLIDAVKKLIILIQMNNKLYIILFSFLLFTSYSEANICSQDTSLNITVMVDEELTCSYSLIVAHKEFYNGTYGYVSIDTIHSNSIVPGRFVISKAKLKEIMIMSNRIFLCIPQKGHDDLVVSFTNEEQPFWFYNIYTKSRLRYRLLMSYNFFSWRRYSCVCTLHCSENLQAVFVYNQKKNTMDEIQQEILKWSKYSHGDSKK